MTQIALYISCPPCDLCSGHISFTYAVGLGCVRRVTHSVGTWYVRRVTYAMGPWDVRHITYAVGRYNVRPGTYIVGFFKCPPYDLCYGCTLCLPCHICCCYMIWYRLWVCGISAVRNMLWSIIWYVRHVTYVACLYHAHDVTYALGTVMPAMHVIYRPLARAVHHAPPPPPTSLQNYVFLNPQRVHNKKWDVNSKNIGTHYWFTALF